MFDKQCLIVWPGFNTLRHKKRLAASVLRYDITVEPVCDAAKRFSYPSQIRLRVLAKRSNIAGQAF